MGKVIKNSPDSLPQSPVTGEYVDTDRILETECQIVASRNNVEQGLKSLELNGKLDNLRLMVLENIEAILRDMGIPYDEMEAQIGRRDREAKVTWSEIDEMVSHILLKWCAIKSEVPEGSNVIREFIEGEVDPVDIDLAYAEVASNLGFGDYDEMSACIELGRESEKRNNQN